MEEPHEFGQDPKWRKDREPTGKPSIYTLDAAPADLDLLDNPYEHKLRRALGTKTATEQKYASLRKHANLGGVIGGTLALPLAVMASTQGGGHAGRVFNLGRRTGNAAQVILSLRKGSSRPLPSKPGLRRYTDAEIAAMPEFSAYADRLTDPEDLLLDMPSELATRYQELTEGVPEEQKVRFAADLCSRRAAAGSQWRPQASDRSQRRRD